MGQYKEIFSKNKCLEKNGCLYIELNIESKKFFNNKKIILKYNIENGELSILGKDISNRIKEKFINFIIFNLFNKTDIKEVNLLKLSKCIGVLEKKVQEIDSIDILEFECSDTFGLFQNLKLGKSEEDFTKSSDMGSSKLPSGNFSELKAFDNNVKTHTKNIISKKHNYITNIVQNCLAKSQIRGNKNLDKKPNIDKNNIPKNLILEKKIDNRATDVPIFEKFDNITVHIIQNNKFESKSFNDFGKDQLTTKDVKDKNSNSNQLLNTKFEAQSLDLNLEENYQNNKDIKNTNVSIQNLHNQFLLPKNYKFPVNHCKKPNIEYHCNKKNILFVSASKIFFQIKCEKCLNVQSSNISECKKCKYNISVSYIPSVHNKFLGRIDLKGCSFVSFNYNRFEISCSYCDFAYKTSEMGIDRKFSIQCYNCSKDLFFELLELRYIAPTVDFFSPKQGTNLPQKGACKHYKKSYRWFRFRCCNKAYPCEECHNADNAHLPETGSKMICGICSLEQPISSCCRCGMNINKSSSHWEGGKGNRNKETMSKKDKKNIKGNIIYNSYNVIKKY
ncbi:hypothetical protein EDEG_00505 [Edhazardia aedis USNM 41457]|uniref:CHY-type domain-containing protein n=1 Tax=Edhazardia aedis (strain USNM 41457) TaxID=1003232 RepID=J8ZNM5_EDHAE|nr:hypothetical protein EDEG_00505 [Edhazardia aedis USNM 41457]|eukprot:EJW01288.1 hypothetical protein EDEG_00505 [Edhazardia aedis USNM 41457]